MTETALDSLRVSFSFTEWAPTYTYNVYGINVHSQIRLPLPESSTEAPADVKLVLADPSFFRETIQDTPLTSIGSGWYKFGNLADGSTYVRWENLFQFLVSPDGRHVTCGHLGPSPEESFETYLLGHTLSYALVKQGIEPLHATSIVANGKALALLGESGHGKSTLAACLLAAGHRLLTDDLLLTKPSREGMLAQPGPPRIKLFPHVAYNFLGSGCSGAPMNPLTDKLVIPLEEAQVCRVPVPLHCIYVLSGPGETLAGETLRIVPLSEQQAFLELIKGTFNSRITGPDRLRCQFAAAAELVKKVPVKRLVYPRVMSQLPEVRDAILADLEQEYR